MMIELRNDTLTKPMIEMRKAMYGQRWKIRKI